MRAGVRSDVQPRMVGLLAFPTVLTRRALLQKMPLLQTLKAEIVALQDGHFLRMWQSWKFLAGVQRVPSCLARNAEISDICHV